MFSKGKPKTINLITDKRNIYGGTRIYGGDRQRDGSIVKAWGNKNGVRRKKFGVRSNVWRVVANSQTSVKGHPAAFPESIARDHIISWSKAGDVVLDPMCGSGTTLKMAVEQGRQYIGIDISEEYCELSRNRVATARRPLPIIVEE